MTSPFLVLRLPTVSVTGVACEGDLVPPGFKPTTSRSADQPALSQVVLCQVKMENLQECYHMQLLYLHLQGNLSSRTDLKNSRPFARFIYNCKRNQLSLISKTIMLRHIPDKAVPSLLVIAFTWINL